MTKTQYDYVHEGESFSGGPLYRVETPAGSILGYVASSSGKRGKTWMAYTPLNLRSVTGFRNRDEAARYLERIAS